MPERSKMQHLISDSVEIYLHPLSEEPVLRHLSLENNLEVNQNVKLNLATPSWLSGHNPTT